MPAAPDAENGAPAVATESRRIAGIDLARGLAIAGMMAAHIVGDDATGLPKDLHAIAGGRASATFAVLAGLSLGLAYGRVGDSSATRAAARVSVVLRGVLIAVLGLALVSLKTPVAIILPYYGVAFAAMLPVLWWPARRLFPLAVSWLVFAPVLSSALRQDLPWSPGRQPTLAALEHPLDLLRTLVLTGYYPVLGWTGYLLLGLAVSRLNLRDTVTAVRLLAAGALAAAGAWIASGLLLGPLGGAAVLGQARSGTFYGTTPAISWWWLAIRAPHSGTPLDLLHTSGCAVAVLALMLLLPRVLTLALTPLAAFGSMPLTMYTAHILALDSYPADRTDQPGLLLALHVLIGCVLASGWRATLGRGPLETALTAISRGAGTAVLPRPPALRR